MSTIDNRKDSGSSSGYEYNEEDAEMLAVSYKCLVCPYFIDDHQILFNHMNENHQINVENIVKQFNIDDYEWIKLINYIRSVKEFKTSELINRPWSLDEYLMPHLDDDHLLSVDVSGFLDGYSKEETDNDVLKSNDKLMELFNTRHEEIMNLINCDETPIEKSNSIIQQEDDAYFGGYSHYQIHDTMIKDTIRTESYRNFIENAGIDYFRDKVVLDVGCGTGILSLFAARAGAKHVYSIDCADIIFSAMEIVKKNGYDHKITMIHGKLEEVDLPVKQVDVIISEWMGYMLLFESMLESVIYAGCKYLGPEGHILPKLHQLILVGATLSEYKKDNLECWDNVCGFDMSCVKRSITKEVIVNVIPSDEIMTQPVILRKYDLDQEMLKTPLAKKQIQDVQKQFELISTQTSVLGGLVLYFDTQFDSSVNTVAFSTGPHAEETHWQQSVLLLDEPVSMVANQSITGEILIQRHDSGRRGLKVYIKLGDLEQQRYEMC